MTDPRLISVGPAAVPPAPARVIGPAPVTRTEPLLRWVLGDILRRIRQQQGRTLKDVSLCAQVSMPYLSEVERGLKEASSEVVAAICHALDLTVADLLALAHGELSDVPASRAILSDTEVSDTEVSDTELASGPMGAVSLSVAA